MDADVAAMLADLGADRSFQIRNAQIERQENVDPKALAAARRTNHRGTDEAKWAMQPGSVNALSTWNNFAQTVDPDADQDDGATGQAHRARVTAALQTNARRRHSPAGRGGRFAGFGRGGAFAAQPSTRPNLVAVAGNNVVTERPVVNTGRLHANDPIHDIQRQQQLDLAKSLAADFSKARQRHRAGRKAPESGRPTLNSEELMKRIHKTLSPNTQTRRVANHGDQDTKTRPPLLSAPPRTQNPVPPMISSSNFLDKFLQVSNLGAPAKSTAQESKKAVSTSRKEDSKDDGKAVAKNTAGLVTGDKPALQQPVIVSTIPVSQSISVPPRNTEPSSVQEELIDLGGKFETLGLQSPDSGRFQAQREGRSSYIPGNVQTNNHRGMLSPSQGSPSSISHAGSESSSAGVDPQNANIRAQPLHSKLENDSHGPARTIRFEVEDQQNKRRPASPAWDRTSEDALFERESGSKVIVKLPTVSSYANKVQSSGRAAQSIQKAAATRTVTSKHAVENTTQDPRRNTEESTLPMLGPYKVLPARSPAGDVAAQTALAKLAAAKKVTPTGPLDGKTPTVQVFGRLSPVDNAAFLSPPIDIGSPGKKGKARTNRPSPVGLGWLTDDLNRDKTQKVKFPAKVIPLAEDPRLQESPIKVAEEIKNNDGQEQPEAIEMPTKSTSSVEKPNSEQDSIEDGEIIEDNRSSIATMSVSSHSITSADPGTSLINALSHVPVSQPIGSKGSSNSGMSAPNGLVRARPVLKDSIYAADGVESSSSVVSAANVEPAAVGFIVPANTVQGVRPALTRVSSDTAPHWPPYHRLPIGQRPVPAGLKFLFGGDQAENASSSKASLNTAARSTPKDAGSIVNIRSSQVSDDASSTTARRDIGTQTPPQRTVSMVGEHSTYVPYRSKYEAPGAGFASLLSDTAGPGNAHSEPQNLEKSNTIAKSEDIDVSDATSEVSRGRRRHR